MLLLWPLFLLITVGQLCFKWGNLAWLVGPVRRSWSSAGSNH